MMPRELKFRAWDGVSKKMLEPQDLSQNIKHWKWLGKYDLPLMQYTGLKDKNGVEIYEGDVLMVCNGSINGHPWMQNNILVSFSNGCYNTPAWSMDSTHWFEVIGNTYQNPELLQVS